MFVGRESELADLNQMYWQDKFQLLGKFPAQNFVFLVRKRNFMQVLLQNTAFLQLEGGGWFPSGRAAPIPRFPCAEHH